MASYHIIPSKYLIGRLIYFISLYGVITAFLFHLRYISLEIKYKRFYFIAAIFSISKMTYHLWLAIFKYRYNEYLLEYGKSLTEYQNERIDYEKVLLEYNKILVEYNFKIFDIDCEVFAAVFSIILFIVLITFKFNNNGRMDKR